MTVEVPSDGRRRPRRRFHVAVRLGKTGVIKTNCLERPHAGLFDFRQRLIIACRMPRQARKMFVEPHRFLPVPEPALFVRCDLGSILLAAC